MKFLSVALVALLVSACATQAEKNAAADTYYKAQQSFVATQATAKKPIFELRGVEGQTIELKGVQSLVVWGGGGEQQAKLEPAPVQRSEAVEGLSLIKETVLGLGPYWLGAKVINGITKISNDGHGPVTNTTTSTTTSNANQANSSTVSNANQANTTTSSAGSNSVIGSGSASTPSTSTTSTSTTTNSQHGSCTTGSC